MTWPTIPNTFVASTKAVASQVNANFTALKAALSSYHSLSNADYTVTDIDGYRFILVTTGNTNRTITLPTVADNDQRIITIKKIDSGTGTVIVDGEGAETIDGQTTFTLQAQYDFITIIAKSTAWFIVDGSPNVTLPSQSGNSGKVLQTNATIVSWQSALTNPMSAVGDMIVGGTSGTPTRLASSLLGYITTGATSTTVTMTIATPAVVTHSSHGLSLGDKIYLTTTGALPTGLTASTTYYVIKIDANSYNLATSLANALAGTKIATSGSQSGTHTCVSGGVQYTNIKGDFSGAAIPEGDFGQVVEPTTLIAQTTATTSEADVTNASITLTPGTWRIEYSATVEVATGAASGDATQIYCAITDSANTHIGRTERIASCKTVAAVSNYIDACLHAATVVNISTSTTYKLRVKKVETGTGAATVLVSAGNQNTTFFATRIA